jgi:hypothetical protein
MAIFVPPGDNRILPWHLHGAIAPVMRIASDRLGTRSDCRVDPDPELDSLLS